MVVLGDFGANEGSADLSDGLPTDTGYEFNIEAFTQGMTSESFTPMDDFDYFTAAFQTDRIIFEVPEPGALALEIAALLSLLGIRRSQRRCR